MTTRYRISPLACCLIIAFGCGSPELRPEGVAVADCPEPTTPGAELEADAVDDGDARTVVLDGTPEVPDSLRERLSQYLETRSASLAGLAPDGRSLTILTRFAETTQVHRVASPLGARTQLTFREEPVRSAEPMPDDESKILLLSDVGGAEDNQIFLLDTTSGRTTLLTDGESRHGGFVVSRDGSRVAFNHNARNGADMDVYVSDGLALGGARRVVEEEGHWHPMRFSRDGRRLLVGHYVSINDARIYVLDLESGERTRLSPESPRASYRSALFSADGRRVYLTSDREGEFVELYEVDPAAPETSWRPLSRDIPWNVESISLSPSGRTLAVSFNEDGYSSLRLMDTRSGRFESPRGLPRGLISGMRFARDAEVLGMSLLSSTGPGDVYTYDLRRRALTRWTESEVGGLDASRFVEPSLFRYESFDGREIPCFLYRPEGDGPFPVLVSIHGGPESQARPWFSPLYQYLVRERGIAVLVPNVRGSDGYGKTYLQLDNGRLREDSVRDIGALLDWVGEHSELDAERVAVFGGSYGGYMVLASLVHFGERLRAGVNVVGISNFVTFLENTRDYRRDLRRAEYGDERDPEMREHLLAISPLTRASEIRSALFVAHGANDPRVPVSEAEQLVEAVRAAGQDVWYMLARNEGHGFVRKENRDLYLQLTVRFLETHLTPGD